VKPQAPQSVLSSARLAQYWLLQQVRPGEQAIGVSQQVKPAGKQ
jgi:hypothetical protein